MKSTSNQRKEHNVEKYIQWARLPSPTKPVHVFICLAVVASQI